jgi:hypothetical protein
MDVAHCAPDIGAQIGANIPLAGAYRLSAGMPSSVLIGSGFSPCPTGVSFSVSWPRVRLTDIAFSSRDSNAAKRRPFRGLIQEQLPKVVHRPRSRRAGSGLSLAGARRGVGESGSTKIHRLVGWRPILAASWLDRPPVRPGFGRIHRLSVEDVRFLGVRRALFGGKGFFAPDFPRISGANGHFSPLRDSAGMRGIPFGSAGRWRRRRRRRNRRGDRIRRPRRCGSRREAHVRPPR